MVFFRRTSPTCIAHRTAPLGAFPVPSSFIRLRQPNHPPTQPIATAKLPMATIATGPSHGAYRRHAIPSTPPKERERKCACAAAGAQNNKMPPDGKLCDLHHGVCDGSEIAPIGPIIGHSDRAKSEQIFRAITLSISTTASMDTTPHENAHMRTSSDSPQPAIIGRR